MCLVNVLVISWYKQTILSHSKAIMRPEAIVEGEIVLLFILVTIFIQYSSPFAHVYATDAPKKFLALVEWSYSYCNFDAHY